MDSITWNREVFLLAACSVSHEQRLVHRSLEQFQIPCLGCMRLILYTNRGVREYC